MSLSKKKYSFHRKKSENRQNKEITPQLYTYENEPKEHLDYPKNLNREISLDNLISQTNMTKEELKKGIPIPKPKENNNINDKNKEKENMASNSNIQYLINQNETENFDFINTLLKLKGISLETKGYKSSKNINIIKNFDEENIFSTKSSKNNNIILNNNQGKYNKSIPSNCSTSTSKINTINCNYHNNQNEEEENLNYKKLDTFSSNDMINNIDNMNNNNSAYNNNILKKEQNLLKELTANENKKKSSKDTISSECNTSNTAVKGTTKAHTYNINNNIISTKEDYTNLKYSEYFDNKSTVKLSNDNKKETIQNNNISINNTKSIEQNKAQLNIPSKNKIVKKKSIKRIPHTKKKIYEINAGNNKSNNNQSKEKKSNSKNKINSTEIKSHKRVNSKQNDMKGKIPNKNLKSNELLNNNIGSIKAYIDNERYITNKKESDKNYNTEIKHESNINNKNNYNLNSDNNVEKKLIFESKDSIDKINLRKKEDNKNIKSNPNMITNDNEYIKEIDLREIKKNHPNNKNNNFNKIKINNMIKKNSKKENLFFDVPFNSERKTTKIFKMTDNIKMKMNKNISPNRSNNLSQINSRNLSIKKIHVYKNTNNLNSYVKIAKNKHYISPAIKNKNKRYTNLNNINKTNYHEDYITKLHDNSQNNFSFNSININLNNDKVINNNKKEKKSSKLLNKIEQSSSKNKEKDYIIDKNKNSNEEDIDNLNKTIDMNDVEFNDDGISNVKEEKEAKEIREIKELKEVNHIDSKYSESKKQNKAKFAEIFLFDNTEEKNEII